jgi:signal transduction histidine kinase
MLRHNLTHVPVTIVTVGHGLALLLFLSPTPGIADMPRFPPQFMVLLGVSWVSAILPAILPYRRWFWVFIAIRILCAQLIGIPLGESLLIDAILAMTLMVDCAFRYSGMGGVLPATLSLLLLVFFQRPVSAWGIVQAQPHWSMTLTAAFFCLAAWALALFVRTLEDEASISHGTIEQMNTAILKLTRTNIGFQHYALSVEERSAQNERNRITREIHDTAGYTLTNLRMMMEAAIRICSREDRDLDRILHSARDQAWQGLTEVRRALRLLRAGEVKRDSVAAAVFKLTRTFQEATGVDVAVTYAITSRSFGEAIDLALYRTIQEGITNAFRHGKVTRIDVYLWESDSEVILNVRDNGAGKVIVKEGIGLAGMRERVRSLGGEVRVESESTGFKLSVRIPRGVPMAVKGGSDDTSSTG